MKKPPVHKPNYFYAYVSVTLVLFLLGLFGLMAVQGQQFIKELKEKVEVTIELKEDTSPGSIDTLKLFLSEAAFTKPNSIRFVSKEEIATIMQDELGDDFLKLEMANPFYDVLVFHVKADWMQPDSIRSAREQIKEFLFVSDVFYQESMTDAIAQNFRQISVWVLGIGLFFVLVAIALILNTIRLALYANRFLIKNMELVGASWGFISRPFLKKSFWQGITCSLLAIVLLSGLLYLVYQSRSDWMEALNLIGVGVVFSALLMLGLLITVFSTYFVLRKYLRMRVDEMY